MWWGADLRGLQEKDGKKGREMLGFHFIHTTCKKQEQPDFEKAVW